MFSTSSTAVVVEGTGVEISFGFVSKSLIFLILSMGGKLLLGVFSFDGEVVVIVVVVVVLSPVFVDLFVLLTA